MWQVSLPLQLLLRWGPLSHVQIHVILCRKTCPMLKLEIHCQPLPHQICPLTNAESSTRELMKLKLLPQNWIPQQLAMYMGEDSWAPASHWYIETMVSPWLNWSMSISSMINFHFSFFGSGIFCCGREGRDPAANQWWGPNLDEERPASIEGQYQREKVKER